MNKLGVTVPEHLQDSVKKIGDVKLQSEIYNLLTDFEKEKGKDHILDLVKYYIGEGNVGLAHKMIRLEPSFYIKLMLDKDPENQIYVMPLIEHICNMHHVESAFLIAKRIGGELEEEILLYISEGSRLSGVSGIYKETISKKEFQDQDKRKQIVLNIFQYELRNGQFELAFDTMNLLDDQENAQDFKDYLQEMLINGSLYVNGVEATLEIIQKLPNFESRLNPYLLVLRHCYHIGDYEKSFDVLLESRVYDVNTTSFPGWRILVNLCRVYIEKEKNDELFAILDKFAEEGATNVFLCLLASGMLEGGSEIEKKISRYIEGNSEKTKVS